MDTSRAARYVSAAAFSTAFAPDNSSWSKNSPPSSIFIARVLALYSLNNVNTLNNTALPKKITPDHKNIEPMMLLGINTKLNNNPITISGQSTTEEKLQIGTIIFLSLAGA